MSPSEARRIRAMVEVGADSHSDSEAARGGNKRFHSKWKSGIVYTSGKRVQYEGKLFRCLQKHTSQNGWEPDRTPSLWEAINEIHDGTRKDPIPYEGNMALEKNKYYIQDDRVYRCIRNTNIPIYNPLEELIKLYVEEVTQEGSHEGHHSDSRPDKH